jgi:hypothetical protein
MADAGMQPMEVIKSATSIPAGILGANDRGVLAVGKTADFLAMPSSPLDKMSNIKDVGILYVNGSEQERTALIQNIQINASSFTISAKDRTEDAKQGQEEARKQAEDKLPHYGSKFPLNPSSVLFHGVPIPTPMHSKSNTSGDRVTVSMAASAADLKDFYAKVLPAAYHWTPAGNCFEKGSKKACVEASNGSAVITVTDK